MANVKNDMIPIRTAFKPGQFLKILEEALAKMDGSQEEAFVTSLRAMYRRHGEDLGLPASKIQWLEEIADR